MRWSKREHLIAQNDTEKLILLLKSLVKLLLTFFLKKFNVELTVVQYVTEYTVTHTVLYHCKIGNHYCTVQYCINYITVQYSVQ